MDRSSNFLFEFAKKHIIDCPLQRKGGESRHCPASQMRSIYYSFKVVFITTSLPDKQMRFTFSFSPKFKGIEKSEVGGSKTPHPTQFQTLHPLVFNYTTKVIITFLFTSHWYLSPTYPTIHWVICFNGASWPLTLQVHLHIECSWRQKMHQTFWAIQQYNLRGSFAKCWIWNINKLV